MSPLALIFLSLGWSAVLWIGASLLCRLNPSPHQAQAIWRVAAGLMVLPFLVSPFLSGTRAGMGAALPDLPLMEVLTVNPGAATESVRPSWALPAWLTLDRIILLILVAGWAARMVTWLIGQTRLQSLKRHAQASPLNASTWARALDLSQTPDVRLTPSGSPFVAGVARPVVYLPRGLQSCAEVQQMIAHECIHLKRGDLVARPIERLVADLFWFSPFAWSMRGALDYWREAVVDADAVHLTGDRIAYARALTQTARLSRPVVHLPVAAFILPRKGTLKMRLTHVLHTQTRQPKRLAAAAAVAIALAVPMALAQGALMKGDIAPAAVYSHAVLDTAKLTSEFGTRKHPITGEMKLHSGVDLAEEEGKPVYTPAAGIVVRAENAEGYGNLVEVSAGDTILRFGQLRDINVSDGDAVSAGDVIGTLGQSGQATGPHLHFEVFRGGSFYNPQEEKGLVLASVLKDTTGGSTSIVTSGPSNDASGPAPQPIPASAPAVPEAESVCSPQSASFRAHATWFADTATPDSWAARLTEAQAANAALGLAISSKSWNPDTIDYPQPSYPKAAAEAGKGGACQVLFDISPEGLPVNVAANCSDPVFEESATAMSNAKFVPAKAGGKPVTLRGVIYPLQYCVE